MARGGSSGGGRSSGGSFGGSRGSGGRIGGSSGFGRSGRSGSSGSFGGGLSGRSSSPFNTGNRGSSYRGPGMIGGPGGCAPGGCGCGIIPLIIVIIIIVTFVLIAVLASFVGGGSGGDGGSLTPSTIVREPLPKGDVNETDYYRDELDWIGNPTKLISGLRHFYQKTGVQPFLYITDNVNGSHFPSMEELDVFANSLYDELFTDEAHLLLVFFEYENMYMTRYIAGTQAKSVIDMEAGDILLDYIDRYYYDDNLTDEEFFAKSFQDAADRMMKVTRSPWIPVLIVITVLAVLFLLFIWWKNSKKQKNLEALQTEKILNTPLEKFKDKETDDLAKKYDDKEL